jgi:hypothetical protein
VRADSTSSEPRRQNCDRGRYMAHHHHLMSVPNKAFHSKNQRTRARDSFIPFALPLSFPKAYLSNAPKSKRANTNRDSNKLGQPYQTTAAPAAPYTYLNPAKFQKETIRPNQVSISRSEIIENLSVSKHVHSNNDPTQRLKTMGIAVTCSMRRKTKQTCPQC